MHPVCLSDKGINNGGEVAMHCSLVELKPEQWTMLTPDAFILSVSLRKCLQLGTFWKKKFKRKETPMLKL